MTLTHEQMTIALARLVGGKQWVLSDLTIIWNDAGSPPTTAELEAEYLIYEAEEAQTVVDEAQKVQDILDNIPSWSVISTKIDNISNLTDAKVVLKKIAKVVAILASERKSQID